jgi:signal transduction histidine kinase
MRTLLLELRPATLAEAKVEELFRHLAEAATGRARIPVTVDIDHEITLPTDIKIAFYRIAQEALNNIIKYSDAGNASISIKAYKQGNMVLLRVIDDGCGFNISEVKGSHLGLGIMKERALAAEMEFNIKSEINHGTEIEVKWMKRKEDG